MEGSSGWLAWRAVRRVVRYERVILTDARSGRSWRVVFLVALRDDVRYVLVSRALVGREKASRGVSLAASSCPSLSESEAESESDAESESESESPQVAARTVWRCWTFSGVFPVMVNGWKRSTRARERFGVRWERVRKFMVGGEGRGGGLGGGGREEELEKGEMQAWGTNTCKG